MTDIKDFAALARRLQQQRTQALAALHQGLGEVVQTLEQALGDELAAVPELRDSIGHSVQGLVAVVGSGSEALLHREQGSAALPPQPAFAQAASHSLPAIEQGMAAALVRGMAAAS